MRIRIIPLILLLIMSTSCEYFNSKKKSNLQEIDTIIDFSSVDASPTFTICNQLIDKEKKDACFRKTIYKHLSQSLAKYKIEVKKTINEVIKVEVIIDRTGKTSVKRIISSPVIQEVIQNLDSLVKASIARLPKLSPAIKRGIPVTTQYQIPIQISVK